METKRLNVDHNVDYDEGWCKIVKNVDTVVAIVETSHVVWKYAKKKKLMKEIDTQIMACVQRKKGILLVDSLTDICRINETLKSLCMYLNEKLQQREQLGEQDISCCWVECFTCPLVSEAFGSPPVHYHNFSSLEYIL